MILTFLLNALYALLEYATSFLPMGSLPAGISTSFVSLVGFLNVFNYFFPIDTLFQVLAAAIVTELAFLGWNLTWMLIRFVRGN